MIFAQFFHSRFAIGVSYRKRKLLDAGWAHHNFTTLVVMGFSRGTGVWDDYKLHFKSGLMITSLTIYYDYIGTIRFVRSIFVISFKKILQNESPHCKDLHRIPLLEAHRLGEC